MAKKNKKTILITGGAGFIGSNLCQRMLREGYRIICLDNFNNFYSPKIKEDNIKNIKSDPDFVLIRGDILDKKLLENIFLKEKIKRIIHLAALAGVRTSLEFPIKYAEVNISGTIKLLEMAKEYKVEQFIFASSSSVYGENSKIPFDEKEKNLIPISPYAATKLSGEIVCRTYQKLYHIPTTILRFFTVYGPGQRPEMAIHKFVRTILEGKPILIFGNGQSTRDYTYVYDIVDGIIKAINTPLDFEIINLGSSKPIKLKKLIKVIGEELNIEPKIIKMPDQSGDPLITYANISKAKKLLKWKPTISIEEGLKEFVNWYKNNY